MSVPTLFARISSFVVNHSLKSVRSRETKNVSRYRNSGQSLEGELSGQYPLNRNSLNRTTRRETASRRYHQKRMTSSVEICEQRLLLAGAQSPWTPLGPFSATNGQVENIGTDDPVVGAIHTVAAHPTDADILYIGAVNGGVWKTTNATAASPNWTPLTDDLPSQSIGALTFDLADATSNTLYAGNGRYGSFGRVGNSRNGLLRTTDGGQSWSVVDGGGTLAGKNISGVYAKGNTIVVSVNVADNFTLGNVGIFRSTDGGASFSQISVGDGSSTGLPDGVSYDLVVDPSDTDTLYTSINFSSGGTDGIYRSTDGGGSWGKVSSAAMDALFVSNTSNVEMAVGNSNEVYVGIINAGNLAALFRSADGIANWTQMDTPSTNENGTDVGLNPKGSKGPLTGTPEEIAGGQGSIHFSIVADPNDVNVVYVGGDRQPLSNGSNSGIFPNSIGANDFSGRLFRGDASKAAGAQFVHLTHSNSLGAAGGGTFSNSSPHADSRDMTFDANGNIIEVDDGGVYRRTSPEDNTGDWFSVIGDLQVTEIHDVSWDSLSNTAISGNQDNGTAYQPTAGAAQWDILHSGDGGDVEVDNLELAGSNQSVRYTSFQGLGLFRRTVWDAAGNLLSTSFPALTPTGGSSSISAAFRTPIQTNSVEGGRLLIQGANSLFESLDGGATINEIGTGVGVSSIISNALWYGGTQSGTDNADVVWAASDSDVFLRSSGLGDVVQTVGDPTNETIRDLAVNSDDWANAFVNDSDQVFVTDNAGASWSDITGNLLSLASDIRSLSYVSTPTNDVVLAGTNAGLFAANLANLGTWVEIGLDLPNVLVFDIDYDASDDILVAGTLGRGAWSLTNASTNIDNAFDPGTNTLSVSLDPSSISENGGLATGIVTRTGSTAGNLVVALSSNDTTEATVPTTVTILDGQSSASFTLTAVDDAIVDGNQTVTVTATATGFSTGTQTIDILDDEVASIDLTIDRASISENGGTATGTVTRNSGTTGDLVVTLASDDTTEATVPATVTILDGQASATFTITGVDDAVVDGTQTVNITATAAGLGSDVESLDVLDDDVNNLNLTIDPVSISENGGLATGTVTRTPGTSGDLVVNLSSNDTTEATVPSSVTILDGQSSATFTITAVDDSIVDGTQVVTITASAAGFVAGTRTLDVLDDDASVLDVVINPDSVSENGGTITGTVRRAPGVAGDLVVSLSSNDTTEATVPTTVTILDGQASANFTITGVDDTIADGTQMVTVTATAAGFVDGTGLVKVLDDDVAALTVSINPAIVSENGGLAAGTVTRNSGTTGDLVVTLASDDTTEATVPATVTILDGQTSANFTITAVDDAIVDGTQTVTITGAAAGFVSGNDTLLVSDDDIAALTVTVDQAFISENGGTATGTVTRGLGTVGNLVVNLSSDDLTEATVPATVTILDGQSSANFAITAVDDLVADGVQTVNITASAAGLADGVGQISVTDDETIDYNFVRLDPLGSQVFSDQNRQVTLTGPGDEAVFGFYGQAGEQFSALVTPTDPNAIVTLEIVELSQAFSSTVPGDPLVVSGEVLPLSQFYRIRITSSVADTIELDSYLNATLEQQSPFGGDSSAFFPVAIDNSQVDFGVERYAIVGNANSAFDTDIYTVDLTGRIGEKVEIVLDGLVEDFGGATLELYDPNGVLLGTASNAPLGTDPTNLDLSMMEIDVPLDGIYQLVVSNPGVTGDYLLTVATESIGFDLEPNNLSTDSLRDLTNTSGAMGFVGVASQDLYTVTLNAGEALFLSTTTPLDDPLGTPLNSLDPLLTVLNPDGSLAATDDNFLPDGKNAQLSFVATQTGTYQISLSSVSGEGEYVMDMIINHPPDILSDTFTIPENSLVGTVVGTVTASDPDNDLLTYTIAGGNPGGTFAIDTITGQITVNNSALLDFETRPFFDLIVQATDNGVQNLSDLAVIRINLSDVNEEPFVNDQNFSIDENSPNGTSVGTMLAGDVDAGDSLTYTIESGNTDGAYAINAATGEITVANSAALNFESANQTIVLVIRVTDSAGLFDEADATITLNDINDVPVINDQNFQVNENSPSGTVVGTVVASDEDQNPVDQLSFTILSGNTDGAFSIDFFSGVITVANPLAVNFEVNPTFDLQVQVSDNRVPALTDVATIHIDVLDLVDGVSVPFFDGFESYPVVNPPGNPLPPGSPWVTSSTNIGRARVTDLYQPFEGDKHLLLESSAIDNVGSLNEVVLEVNPGNAEQIILEFAEREYLDEDNPMSAVFTGSENSDGVAISSDGVTWYRVVSLTGNTSTSLYQEFSFNLSTLAGEFGLDLTQNFFIKLQQFDNFPATSDGIAFDNVRIIGQPLVNLPPVVQDQLFYINENPVSGLIAGRVLATDPNAGDTISYAIVSGNDAGTFSINAMTGEIRVERPEDIDFETNPVFRLGVQVTDGGTPGLTDTAEVTIQVKNVVERDALFFDDFEDGTLDKWTTSSTNTGRIQNTTGNGPAQGANHLTFDSSSNSATNSLNEAGFSFDGTGYKDIVLSMYQREFNDEDHPIPDVFTGSVNGDGISISVDGTNWYRVESLVGPASTEVYQHREYDLSALAQAKGLNLQGTVLVKLQAYDNFEIPFDGMAFDDVLVDGVPVGPAPPSPVAPGLAGLAVEGGQLNWYVTSESGGVANGLSENWGTAGPANQGVLDVKSGDFNGDGRDDVVFLNDAGEWWVGLSDSTQFGQFLWTRWDVGQTSFSHVSVGDFNGDGRVDLLGMDSNGYWWVGESQGSVFKSKKWTKWKATANWKDVRVADFNNDGKDDIVGRAQSGRLTVGLSNGKKFNNSKWGQWSKAVTWQDVSVGDFNGDGLADITGRANSGKWRMSLSQGNAFATSTWSSWTTSGNWNDVVVGDFNMDGKDDLAGRRDSNKWWVAISKGNTFKTTFWGKWNAASTWSDVRAGDFNADGKTDIAGRDENGVWENLLSQGTSFLNQVGAQWDAALNWVGVSVGVYTAPAIPVTPPPAAPAASSGLGEGAAGLAPSSAADSSNGPSLVYQAVDTSDAQDGQNSSSAVLQKPEDTMTPTTDTEGSSVEELFGDQSLLDMLADLT